MKTRVEAWQKQLQQDLLRDLNAFRTRVAEAVDDEAWKSVAITVVPHQDADIVPLDPEQRSAFEMHLRAVALAAASSTDEAPVDGDDDVDPLDQELAQDSTRRVAAAVCSACRGRCCYPGNKNNAFIETRTLQRYARVHTGVTPEDVVAAYLAHVPQRHFEGSCVYHTARGCSLPRAMRSATCNRFACSGLQNALETDVDDSSQRRFVVARHNNRIVCGVLIDKHGSREVLSSAKQPGDTVTDRNASDSIAAA
jgi:hypothetical protein